MAFIISKIGEKNEETIKKAEGKKRVPIPEEVLSMIEALGKTEEDVICYEDEDGLPAVLFDEEATEIIQKIIEDYGVRSVPKEEVIEMRRLTEDKKIANDDAILLVCGKCSGVSILDSDARYCPHCGGTIDTIVDMRRGDEDNGKPLRERYDRITITVKEGAEQEAVDKLAQEIKEQFGGNEIFDYIETVTEKLAITITDEEEAEDE